MDKVLVHRREPFELMFLALLVVSGLTQLATGIVPGSIDALMPSWVHVFWLLLMTAGSAVALGGISMRNIVNGIFLESVGIFTTGVTLMIYAAAQLVFAGTHALIPATITFAVVIAFAARWRELRRVIKMLPRR